MTIVEYINRIDLEHKIQKVSSMMTVVFSDYVHWYGSMARMLTAHVGGTQHIVVESMNKWLWRFLS